MSVWCFIQFLNCFTFFDFDQTRLFCRWPHSPPHGGGCKKLANCTKQDKGKENEWRGYRGVQKSGRRVPYIKYERKNFEPKSSDMLKISRTDGAPKRLKFANKEDLSGDVSLCWHSWFRRIREARVVEEEERVEEHAVVAEGGGGEPNQPSLQNKVEGPKETERHFIV